jgi:hypothetical protein
MAAEAAGRCTGRLRLTTGGMSLGCPVAAPRIPYRRCESEWGTPNRPGSGAPL